MDDLAYDGSRFKVRWAITRNGEKPAAEFYETLSDHDKTRLLVLFERLDNEGRIANREHFTKLQGTDLFEFKRSQIRVLCFFTKCSSVVLTHGFIKKQQRTPPNEIERGERIMSEHLERCDDCNGVKCL